MKGINLAERHKSIESIIRRNFTASADAAGIEVEDLVQDVFIKLMRTNSGTRPYDPDRASLGTFVYLVAQSVLRKEIRKKTRVKRPQGVPLPISDGWEEGGYVPEDLHPESGPDADSVGLLHDVDRYLAAVGYPADATYWVWLRLSGMSKTEIERSRRMNRAWQRDVERDLAGYFDGGDPGSAATGPWRTRRS